MPVPDGLAQRLLDAAGGGPGRTSRRPTPAVADARPDACSRLAGGNAARWVVGWRTRWRPRRVAGRRRAGTPVGRGLHAVGRARRGHAVVRRRADAGDAAGYLLAETPAPADYPLSGDVLEVPQVRWRWVEGFLGGKAVAYDLPEPGGSRATLYVARRTVARRLPSLPPPMPTPDDGRLLRRRLAARGDALRAGRGRRCPGLPELPGPFPRAADVSCVRSCLRVVVQKTLTSVIRSTTPSPSPLSLRERGSSRKACPYFLQSVQLADFRCRFRQTPPNPIRRHRPNSQERQTESH